MARSRKFVNRHGRPVRMNTGVSYNSARRRCYIIRSDGKRQEFKNGDDASAAPATQQATSIPAEKLSRLQAIARYRGYLAYETL